MPEVLASRKRSRAAEAERDRYRLRFTLNSSTRWRRRDCLTITAVVYGLDDFVSPLFEPDWRIHGRELFPGLEAE